MTPPKATPDRKGKVCKPKVRLKPKNEMREIKQYSPIELDEYSMTHINWQYITDKLTEKRDSFIDFNAYRLLSDESK